MVWPAHAFYYLADHAIWYRAPADQNLTVLHIILQSYVSKEKAKAQKMQVLVHRTSRDLSYR
jgi:hypothetical protein